MWVKNGSKDNGDLLNKQKHLIQLSVYKFHNDLILSVSQGLFPGPRIMRGRLFRGYTSLIKYMPNYINTIININRITCVCGTFISAMLLQSDFNKWRLRQLIFLKICIPILY